MYIIVCSFLALISNFGGGLGVKNTTFDFLLFVASINCYMITCD